MKCYELNSQNSQNILLRITTSILRQINFTNFFPTLNEHQFDNSLNDNHVIELTKTIIMCYAKIKLCQYMKRINDGKTQFLRKKLTRALIIQNE